MPGEYHTERTNIVKISHNEKRNPSKSAPHREQMSPTMTTKLNAQDEQESHQPSALSQGLACAKALLERHAVPRHRQAPLLVEVLDYSPPHAYRLLRGETPWSLELLERLGRHFGEELGDVVSFGLLDTSTAGVLVIDQTRMPCRVWLDERAQEAPAGALVAERADSDWVVSLHKHRGPVTGKLVRRLVVQPALAIWRVAVLDDARTSADNLALELRAAGFDAEAFYTEEALRHAMARTPFDAYLLDWIIGADTARGLIARIREQDAECLIGVMTGEIDTGRAVEADLRDAMRQYRFFFIEKPYRAMLIATQLTQAFAAR